MDLSNWMGNLPSVLHDLPLNWLAIPGSHDSFSYTITANSDVAPDESRIRCWACVPLVKRIIFQWTLTQALHCQDQLNNGVRYFDFRLAPRLGTLDSYIVHGLYGSGVTGILVEIHAFLQQHDKEVVLLDFQHFYNFTIETHAKLVSTIEGVFGRMLCPFGPGPPDVKLSRLWRNGQQVLVFYRNDYSRNVPWLFPSSWIPNPWPNTVRTTTMIRTMDQNYSKGRKPWSFFVNQGILTPNVPYILTHVFSSLRKSLAPQSTRKIIDWLRDKSAGKNGINVVMVDDIGASTQLNFSVQVITLNYKLAQKLSEI